MSAPARGGARPRMEGEGVSHYVYLVRHGEQIDAEFGVQDTGLSPRGQRQATLLADRIGGVPFDDAFMSPLERSVETMEALHKRMPAIQPEPNALLFDCIPSGPVDDLTRAYKSFFSGVSAEEIDAGRAQMADAEDFLLTPSNEDRRTLVVTHRFVIADLVRRALDAPEWKWLALTAGNCSLTVLRVRTAKPTELVTFNDMGHLPAELRTGMGTVADTL